MPFRSGPSRTQVLEAMRRRRQHRLRVSACALGVVLAAGCGGGTAPPPGEGPPPPVDSLHVFVVGFPAQRIPAGNGTTRQGVRLGRKLFYDRILSGDDTQSCGDCHAQAFGFTDNGRRFSVGIDGIAGTRNAPSLANAGWRTSLFWDGRAATLEKQALGPVPNPIEMHEEWNVAVAKLQARAEYAPLFWEAFGTHTITPTLVVKAIAQFERTLVSANSRYDRYLLGFGTRTPEELRGYAVYVSERGDCFHCHIYNGFTDEAFHNNGLDSVYTDLGLGAITGDAHDMGKFKTPTLRNVEFTAPYMHDGRFATLEQVIDHYNSGGFGTPTVDPFIRVGRGLGLTVQEKSDLLAFLKSLSDSTFLTNPDYGPPP